MSAGFPLGQFQIDWIGFVKGGYSVTCVDHGPQGTAMDTNEVGLVCRDHWNAEHVNQGDRP